MNALYEEYTERAENDIKQFRQIVSSDAASKFETVYKSCRDKVSIAGLDGSQDDVDFRQRCLDTFLQQVIPGHVGLANILGFQTGTQKKVSPRPSRKTFFLQ